MPWHGNPTLRCRALLKRHIERELFEIIHIFDPGLNDICSIFQQALI